LHIYLIDLLACPACQGDLWWKIKRKGNNRIEEGDAVCEQCAASYPIRDGIAVFLPPDGQRNDLWEQLDSQLLVYLKEHPEIERKLMRPPVDKLNPADIFFRALVLEERGEHRLARKLERLAKKGLYTGEYLQCWQSQVEWVIGELSGTSRPVIDLASGRGYLVEKMARNLSNMIVATDFSPRVLMRDKIWFEEEGLYKQISFLAVDARRTPFRDQSIGTLTTNLGLPNIEHPKGLLRELRRIVAGKFLGISFFYPQDDEANAKVLKEYGLDMFFLPETTAKFHAADWEMDFVNQCESSANPTPSSEILDGAKIDSFPIMETTLRWGVIAAE